MRMKRPIALVFLLVSLLACTSQQSPGDSAAIPDIVAGSIDMQAKEVQQLMRTYVPDENAKFGEVTPVSLGDGSQGDQGGFEFTVSMDGYEDPSVQLEPLSVAEYEASLLKSSNDALRYGLPPERPSLETLIAQGIEPQGSDTLNLQQEKDFYGLTASKLRRAVYDALEGRRDQLSYIDNSINHLGWTGSLSSWKFESKARVKCGFLWLSCDFKWVSASWLNTTGNVEARVGWSSGIEQPAVVTHISKVSSDSSVFVSGGTDFIHVFPSTKKLLQGGYEGGVSPITVLGTQSTFSSRQDEYVDLLKPKTLQFSESAIEIDTLGLCVKPDDYDNWDRGTDNLCPEAGFDDEGCPDCNEESRKLTRAEDGLRDVEVNDIPLRDSVGGATSVTGLACAATSAGIITAPASVFTCGAFGAGLLEYGRQDYVIWRKRRSLNMEKDRYNVRLRHCLEDRQSQQCDI